MVRRIPIGDSIRLAAPREGEGHRFHTRAARSRAAASPSRGEFKTAAYTWRRTRDRLSDPARQTRRGREAKRERCVVPARSESVRQERKATRSTGPWSADILLRTARIVVKGLAAATAAATKRSGWGTRIRTWVLGVRVRCPTARRSPSGNSSLTARRSRRHRTDSGRSPRPLRAKRSVALAKAEHGNRVAPRRLKVTPRD